MKFFAVVLAVLWAAAALAAEPVPLPRPRPPVWLPPPWVEPSWVEPRSFREAAGPGFDSAAVSAAATECNARLEKIAAIAAIPRLIGPGACGGTDLVRLDAVLVGDARVELKPAPYLRCPMAEQLAVWVRDDVVARAATAGFALRSVDTYDDFNCRGRNRAANGKVSEHGKGNAVDVRGFTLADGRFISLTDVNAPNDLRAAMRERACARFTTVLGPGSDGHHEAHIHLDLIERRNGYRICQWEVRDPPPPKQEKKEQKEVEQAAAHADGEDIEPDRSAAAIAGPVPLPRSRPRLLKRLRYRFL